MLLPLLRHAFAWPALDRAGTALTAAVPADILQYPGKFVICLDLPGVDHSHIKLELYDSNLVISGAGQGPGVASGEDEQVVWLRRERPAPGSFQRVFALPSDVDLDKIKASIDKGVLKVVLPRVRVEQRPTKTIPLSKL